jgi:hypothetical protein
MRVIKRRTMRRAGQLTRMGEKRNVIKMVLAGKAERKITVRKTTCWW